MYIRELSLLFSDILPYHPYIASPYQDMSMLDGRLCHLICSNEANTTSGTDHGDTKTGYRGEHISLILYVRVLLLYLVHIFMWLTFTQRINSKQKLGCYQAVLLRMENYITLTRLPNW